MKNIIKSLTSFLLTAFLLLSFSACLGGNSEENDIVIDGIKYSLYNSADDKYYYVYNVEDKSISSAIIKDYINDLPVKKIGRDEPGWLVGPFKDCISLSEITIPDTVIAIGNSAFEGCEALETITLPSSLEIIDSFAFERCSSLKSISIPDSVKEIGYQSFYFCSSLEYVKMPKHLKTIGVSAFEECTKIKNIDLPNGIEVIEKRAFLNFDYGNRENGILGLWRITQFTYSARHNGNCRLFDIRLLEYFNSLYTKERNSRW